MNGISVSEALALLANHSRDESLREYFTKESQKASERAEELQKSGIERTFCNRSTGEFKEFIENQSNFANVMPVIAPKSGYNGAVMADGNVWNPYIHRRFLPMRTLTRLGSEVVKRAQLRWSNKFTDYLNDLLILFSWGAFAPRYIDTVLEEVLGACKSYDMPSLLRTQLVKSRLSTTSDPIGSYRTFIQRDKWQSRMFKQLDHFVRSEYNTINSLLFGSAHANLDELIPDRYFVRGLVIQGNEIPMEKFWDQIKVKPCRGPELYTSEVSINIDKVVLLYAVTGLWGTITALHNTPEVCGSFNISKEQASGLYKSFRNVGLGWNGYLSLEKLEETAALMYESLTAQLQVAMGNNKKLTDCLCSFSEPYMRMYNVIDTRDNDSKFNVHDGVYERSGLSTEVFVERMNSQKSFDPQGSTGTEDSSSASVVEPCVGSSSITYGENFTPPVYDPKRETKPTQFENGRPLSPYAMRKAAEESESSSSAGAKASRVSEVLVNKAQSDWVPVVPADKDEKDYMSSSRNSSQGVSSSHLESSVNDTQPGYEEKMQKLERENRMLREGIKHLNNYLSVMKELGINPFEFMEDHSDTEK